MLSVIHDKNLGANQIRTAKEQKLLLEAFCNECLQQNNGRAVAGEGPLVYKDDKSVFRDVRHATLEDVYSAFERARQCDGVLREVQKSNNTLRAKIGELEGPSKNGELVMEAGAGEGVGTRGQESPGQRTTPV